MHKNIKLVLAIFTTSVITISCSNSSGLNLVSEDSLRNNTSATPYPSETPLPFTPINPPASSVSSSPSASPVVSSQLSSSVSPVITPSNSPTPKASSAPDFKLNKLYPMRLLSTMNTDGSDKKDLMRIDDITNVSLSPDGTKILFIAPKDNGIYTMNIDGSQLTKLETADVREEFAEKVVIPEWFQDSQKVLIVKGKEIYSIKADGTEKTKITEVFLPDGFKLPYGNAYPMPTPDGKKIFFTEYRIGYKTYLINIDGTGKTEVKAGGGHVKWSRDGKKFASYNPVYGDIINAKPGISIYDLETNQSTFNKYVPSDFDWTPDGKIVYVSRTGDYTKEIVDSINIVNYDGTDNHELSRIVSNKQVYGKVLVPTSFSFSSTAGKVAVVMYRCWEFDENNKLRYLSDEDAVFTGKYNFALHTYTMNLDGSDKKYLNVDNGFYTLYPKWSNDGKKILFTNNILPRDYFASRPIPKDYFSNPYIVSGFFTGLTYLK